MKLAERGLSISAPAVQQSGRGFLHFVGSTPEKFDLTSTPLVASRWRDEFGSIDPAGRTAARAYDERIQGIVRGCLEILGLPWTRVWVMLGTRGHHAVTVTPPVETGTRQLHFSSLPGHPFVGTMSKQLVAALDGIVAEGFHVYEASARWDPATLPTAHLSEDYSFYMRRREDGPLDAMRAIRAVPQGARLILPART